MCSSLAVISLRLLLTVTLAAAPITAPNPIQISSLPSKCPFITERSELPFIGCWTQTNDVHGFDGIPHSFRTLEECRTACVSNKTCVAVDWDPNSTEKSCWILTSTVIGSTMETGVVSHYELNRAFLRCWTQTSPNNKQWTRGTSRNIATLDECQTECANNYSCLAVAWNADSARESCWILTSPSDAEAAAHYQLERACLSSSSAISVWPLFGPQAGGTLLTVTGVDLIDSQQPSIAFATPTLDHLVPLAVQYRTSERSDMSVIVAKTPARNTTGEELLVVVQYVDRPLVNTTRFFVYRQNPDVIDIFPLTHLLSGGTTMTVTGNNLDAAAKVFVTVTVIDTRFNSTGDDALLTKERCTVKNSSILTCTMPRVPSVSQLNGAVYRKESVAARDGPDDYTYYGGLRFDSYDINLTATLPDKPLRFVPSPTFDKIDLIVYRPKSSDDIAITGNDLRRGIRISDYRVVIGRRECNVTSLSNDLLTCHPPDDEPELFREDSYCGDVNSVLVYAGNAGPTWYACIQYETEIDVWLIVGLVLLLGIPLLLLIIVAIIYFCKWLGREKREVSADDDDEIKMSEIVPRRQRPLERKVPVVFAEYTADNDVPTGEDMKPEVDGETPSPDTDEYNLYLYINTHVYSKEGEDEGKKKDKGK